MKKISRELFFLLSLAFSLRLIWMLIVFFKNPDGIWTYDSYGYWYLGKNILQNGVFSQNVTPPFVPDYFRTPLYPIFLSLFQVLNLGNVFIIFTQVILSTLTCYFTYGISQTIFENKNAALVSAFFVAVDVPSVSFSSFVLTETIFGFLFVVFCFLFIKYIKQKKLSALFFSSLILGLAILCRPIAMFLPLLIFLFTFYICRETISRAVTHSSIFFVSVLCVLSPWLIRNKIAFGEFSLSYLGSHTLMSYQASSILAEKNRKDYYATELQFRKEMINKFSGDAVKQPAAFAKFIRGESLKIIRENWGVFVKQHIENVAGFFLKPVKGYLDVQLGNKPTSVFAIFLIVLQFVLLFILYIGFAICLITLCKRKIIFSSYQMIVMIFFLLLIFYFANMTQPPCSEARLRIPVMPLIACVTAVGIFSMKKFHPNNN